MDKNKILVVGSINYDIIFQDLLEEGINYNGMVYGKYATTNGGKGANQACALALLGAEAYLAGCVGNDSYGIDEIQALRDLGVNTDFVRFDSDSQTGLTAMLMRKDNTYICANVLGANGRLTPDLVEEALRSVAFDMVVMQLEMPLETVYRTYEMAAERNIPVILDAGPPKSIPLKRLKGIFVLSPNEDEAEALTGIKIKNENDAHKASQKLFFETEAKHIVIKLGSRGAYYFDGREGKLFPSFKVNAVDSTAAGDSFTAELGISLANGMDIEQAIIRANAAGAICVSRYGSQSSVPSARDVEQFFIDRDLCQ